VKKAIDGQDLAAIAGGYVNLYSRSRINTELPERVLIDALNRYGTAAMAEYFLEDERKRVRQAVRTWAARNGYRVVSVMVLTTSGLRPSYALQRGGRSRR